MYFETTDHVKLHFEDVGESKDGVPVVLIPGWGYSVQVFEKLIHCLKADYRVIALDPRGHGNSEVSENGIDFAQQTKDLIDLLKKLRIKKMYLVGWSYGAYTVLGMVREIGLDCIAGIMVIDQPPRATGDEQTKADQVWVEYMPENLERAKVGLSTEEGYRSGVENFARNAAYTGCISDLEVKKFCSMAEMPYEAAVKEFFAGAKCDFTEEFMEADRCKNCKTVMVIRESWAEQACDYMSKICPDTERYVLGGHMMFWEHEESFISIMEAFLGK